MPRGSGNQLWGLRLQATARSIGQGVFDQAFGQCGLQVAHAKGFTVGQLQGGLALFAAHLALQDVEEAFDLGGDLGGDLGAAREHVGACVLAFKAASRYSRYGTTDGDDRHRC
jgi:hypothetical protein